MKHKIAQGVGVAFVIYVMAFGVWYGTLRNSCETPATLGQTAWGVGAFHSGVGDCPQKAWWKW